MKKTDADIMHETREYIREHGWTQEQMMDDTTGKVCGYGAVAASQGWLQTDADAPTQGEHTCRRILSKVLVAIGVVHKSQRHEVELTDFTNWNDDCAENQQQVEDAFAKAEKIERAGYDPDA